MQGLQEFCIGTGPDARLPVGRDVRRINCADHGLEGQAARERLASRRGVASLAIGGTGEIFTARE